MAAIATTWRCLSGAAAGVAVALTLATSTVAAASYLPLPETSEIPVPAVSGDVIKDSYIVTFPKGINAHSPQARAVAKKYGAKITRTYNCALNGYVIKLNAKMVKRLAEDPVVESVVQDQIVTTSSVQPSPPSWGLDRADQRSLPLNASYSYPDSAGQGVTAYIIDTGVRITHQDFGGRAYHGYDAIDGDNIADDGNGHGTHVAATVAGTAYGTAKKAHVVAVRVFDNTGSGSSSGVIAGIDWVTQHAVKPAVANMSLGGEANSAMDTAVRNSIAMGITYVVAAGNSNADTSTFSPARVSEAITVGATTSTDARASYSNYGSAVDLFAPGSGITSAWIGSDTAANTISGTSMATPHVAGAAAVYLSDHPTAPPAQVGAALISAATAKTVTNPGINTTDRLLYIGSRIENTTDYPIYDLTTTESPITVTGIPGNAPSTLHVPVDIKHTAIGNLQIDLIAPDGSSYRLKNYTDGGTTDNVITTYTVDASPETANGTWKLRVSDNTRRDTGRIDSWALQF
ncbi:S8 family serine peptidase [Streptomyces sp. NPDC057686]|uniref:S8 family peptidase n=1 Tax=Streptomyces sp. NPDC057686 TaxID=3346212 RepID=UPI0036C11533